MLVFFKSCLVLNKSVYFAYAGLKRFEVTNLRVCYFVIILTAHREDVKLPTGGQALNVFSYHHQGC